MLPFDAIPPLLAFVALVLVLALYVLAVSGHFPREHRAQALGDGIGGVILFGSMALAFACLLVGLFAAWHLVPWYAAVVGGCGAILIAPLVLQTFSDRFVDSRGALAALVALACGLSALLALFAGWHGEAF